MPSSIPPPSLVQMDFYLPLGRSLSGAPKVIKLYPYGSQRAKLYGCCRYQGSPLGDRIMCRGAPIPVLRQVQLHIDGVYFTFINLRVTPGISSVARRTVFWFDQAPRDPTRQSVNAALFG